MLTFILVLLFLFASNLLFKLVCLLAQALCKFIRLRVSTPRLGVFTNISLVIPVTTYFSFGINIKALTIHFAYKNFKIIIEATGVDLRFIQTSMIKSNQCEDEINRVANIITQLALRKIPPMPKQMNAFLQYLIGKAIVYS